MNERDAAELEEIARLVARVEGLLDGVKRRATPFGMVATPERRPDLLRRPRPPLPDPRLIRQIIRQRRLRDRHFEADLFADPAWDILLELAAARAEQTRISVSSLCIASAVAATTALRWIGMMTEMGLLVSVIDDLDKRRRYISLSDSAAHALARYFDELGGEAARVV